MKLLNIGCGSRVHPEWVNVDFVSQKKNTISHNLEKGIPFENNYFDIVYHSHLLEHFSKSGAFFLVKECFRVLKSGGIIRVVTPDLEMLTRLYLEMLDKVINEGKELDLNYEWMVIHLFDQSVRNKSGGEMREYLSKTNIKNLTFIENLLGKGEVNNIRNATQKSKTEKARESLKNEGFLHTLRLIIRSILPQNPFKEILLKILLQREYETLQIGRFRQSGEVHQWMYDRYSLTRLLKKNGFIQINQCSAGQSDIPDWSEFFLDIEPNGEIYRPDSIYMEGVKP
jgi:SAM-dependent methyltransferase